ncbi:hypothetical protein Hanom_Chr02g00123151 [Helianthus anomalus]
MHIRKLPSFFLTNRTGAPQGEKLATGAGPGTKSIWNSTCLWGGNPSKSSGKTSGYSFTTGMSSIFGSAASLSTMCARKATHPFCKHFQAFKQLIILKGVSCFSL